MTKQSRLERFELRTEWPLAVVAVGFLCLCSVHVLPRPRGLTGEAVDAALMEDTANRAATAAQIDELREEIRQPAYGEGRDGDRVKGSG